MTSPTLRAAEILEREAAALRQQASDHDARARHVKNGVPVYNPIEWGRADAKREVAAHLEMLARESHD